MKNKISKYENIIMNLNLILESSSPISDFEKMSIISKEIYSKFNYWTFCGFYVLLNDYLKIGPYEGNIIPCNSIGFGKGVCSISIKEKKIIIVDDVSKNPHYIACDSKTKSEIVVPVYSEKKIIAVLDIDSPLLNDFNEIDKEFLEKISFLI